MELSKNTTGGAIFRLTEALNKPVHIAPLVVFRIVFGIMMFASIIRFILKGWVYDLYVMPEIYFPFYGFEWIKPLGETGMYALFGLLAISALFICLGYFYRISSLAFFLGFTFVELIDKSNYLNHYYFISLVSFLMILVPANRWFSLDAFRNPEIVKTRVPAFVVGIFKLQLFIVYFFAGFAKLNYDWLFEAMPLKIWLPSKSHLPLIGWMMDYPFTAYFFSWFGAIYDLSIPFLLMNKRTRNFAYFFVIVFHIMTWLLFQIGMFPFIMILSTLIFFSEEFHLKTMSFLQKIFKRDRVKNSNLNSDFNYSIWKSKIFFSFFAIYFFIQLLLPFRYLFYPGKLFWTEQGYRFSWRVMLMEKAGTAFFYVKDPATGGETEVSNCDYLTKNQEKMMSTQPDMILQFAHFLKVEYQKKGINNPEVRVESYVTLNGSGSRLFIDKNVNLAECQESFLPKTWILPFTKKIKTGN